MITVLVSIFFATIPPPNFSILLHTTIIPALSEILRYQQTPINDISYRICRASIFLFLFLCLEAVTSDIEMVMV